MPALELATMNTKASVSAALRRIETAFEAENTIDLLSEAYRLPRAHVVGMTGPPGVGKSTLMNSLIGEWRKRGKTVGCIAVDPSSRRSGGAFLGDRIRLTVDPLDEGVFVRSMAARERLGGLAAATVPAMVIMRAIFDVVVIETVGVGQSETNIADVADTVVFCVQPGSGDSVQFMKSGIVEIPHIVVVTKADVGPPAQCAQADVAGALHMAAPADDWIVPVLPVSAARGEGVAALADAISEHTAHVKQSGQLAAKRHGHAERYLAGVVHERFGREGLNRADQLSLAPDECPFRRIAAVTSALAAHWR